MDSLAVATMEEPKRRRRSIAEKRRIVELAMQPGASVARVAREHGVNANMVFYWRSQYRRGRLGEKRADTVHLLPVSVSETAVAPVMASDPMASAERAVAPASSSGSIYIEFPKIHLRVENGADAALLRVVLETLQR